MQRKCYEWRQSFRFGFRLAPPKSGVIQWRTGTDAVSEKSYI